MNTTTGSAGTVQNMVYGYDSNGNVTSIADNVAPNNSQQFTYDGLNRLLSAISPSYSTITFTYGAMETSPSTPGGFLFVQRRGSARRDPGGNQHLRVRCERKHDIQAYVCNQSDAHLRLRQPRFELNCRGRHHLVCVRFPGSAGLEEHQRAGFDHHLHRKHLRGDGRRPHGPHFRRKPQDRFENGDQHHLLPPRPSRGPQYRHGRLGNVVQSVFYYPYGETRVNTGSVDLHYKFTGKEIDRESGLYYYGARYYDPVIGRFISPDSVVQSPGDPQTLNRYSYASNNPLANIDPTGHSWFSVALNWFSNNVLEPMSAAFAGAVVGTFAGPQVGGMVAGAIMGAYSGNLTNVIVSASISCMMGGLPPPVNMIAQAGLLGYSVAKNGPNALGSFAGGFVGGLEGGIAGQSLGEAMNQAITEGMAQTADYNGNMRQERAQNSPVILAMACPTEGEGGSGTLVGDPTCGGGGGEFAEGGALGGGATGGAPDYLVAPGGTAFPVPEGAQGPEPVINPQGNQTGTAFIGGSGGANNQVDTIRAMDPTPPRGNSPGYPNGYIKYENSLGQGVDLTPGGQSQILRAIIQFIRENIMDVSKIVIGLVALEVKNVHDYLQVVFSDGSVLNIFNKYFYDGDYISSIEGKELEFMEVHKDKIIFRFRDNGELVVGLRDCDYNGPEAMELRCKDGSPIVWS